jgi:hypothetical protein
MRGTLRSVRPLRLVLVSLAVLGITALAYAVVATKATFDWRASCVKQLTAAMLPDVNALADRVNSDQDFYLRITPSADFVLQQSVGLVAFDAKAFPEEFVAGLVPALDHGCPTYTILVAEDPATRTLIIYNAEGKAIYAIYPAQGYNPYRLLNQLYPDLASNRYTSQRIARLRAEYDPARVQIILQLIPGDWIEAYAEARYETLAARALAALGVDEGGAGMMSMRLPAADSNIVIQAITPQTNGTQLEIGYPTDFTNRLDIFTCDSGRGLLDRWWELGVTTNVNTSTYCIVWTDTENISSNAPVRFYTAANADVDYDSDGFSDGREHFMYHTDPTNSLSKPVSVSGTISYTGTLTGPIRMIAVTSAHSWIGCMATVSGPGAYTNDKVANGTNYWFKAYRDCNSNKTREFGEPWGVYSASSLLATSNLTGINITLTEDTDEDDDGLLDSWELQYFGSIWTQDAADDSDGDSLVNSNEFTYATNPAKADTDHDGLQDGAEVFTYGTNPTNGDTDGDNMGDGAEVINCQQPAVSNSYSQLAFEEGFETNTVGTNLLNSVNGWMASPTNQALLKTNEVHAGQQSVEVGVSQDSVSVSHLVGAHDKSNIWVDFWSQVDPTTITHLETTPDIAAITNGTPTVFAINRYGGIALYDADPAGATWLVVSNCIPELTPSFHRFTVNQDFVNRMWSFYLDGSLVTSNLSLRGNIYELHKFSCQGTQAGASYLDALSIGTNKPGGLSE